MRTDRVDIPKFWTRDDSPNCIVALLPTTNATGRSMSYNVSRYRSIQSVGFGIAHYYVEALGLPGVEGTGGIDSTGDNNKLRLILYAPQSKFDNATIANYKRGHIIAILENTDPETGGEYESAPSSSATSRKRPRTGGMGLMSSSGVQGRTRNLSDGWFLSYDSITSINPTQVAAAKLKAFYAGVVDTAAQQISTVINATENLAFNFDGLNLRLSSSAPISWSWVIDFAADMIDNVGSDFAVSFNGQAYSAYWDIAAVNASLTLL